MNQVTSSNVANKYNAHSTFPRDLLPIGRSGSNVELHALNHYMH